MKFLAVALCLSVLVATALAGGDYTPCTLALDYGCKTKNEGGSCATGFTTVEDVMTTVVLAVFGIATNDTVPGTPGVALKRYFDGTYGGNSVNFLTNDQARGRLANGLINFFGVALGCTVDGGVNSERWNATGHPFVGLAEAHETLEIRLSDFKLFNKVVADVYESVEGPIDKKRGINFAQALQAVKDALAGTEDDIVFPATLSICDRYTGDGTNFALMDLIVNKTVTSVVGDAALLRYFNGAIAGTRNIVASATLVRHLEDALVAFFGQGSVLGCSDVDFPEYEGADLVTAHQTMNISVADFANFNDRLIAVLNQLGVSATDRTAVRSVLDSTSSSIVCNGKPCAGAKAPASASGVIASAAVTVAAVVAALF